MSINHKNKIRRNDPCPCESGLKFKQCHGDQVKRVQCKAAATARMLELIQEEKIRRGVIVVDEDSLKEAYDEAAEKMRKKSDVTARIIG